MKFQMMCLVIISILIISGCTQEAGQTKSQTSDLSDSTDRGSSGNFLKIGSIEGNPKLVEDISSSLNVKPFIESIKAIGFYKDKLYAGTVFGKIYAFENEKW